MSENPSEPFRTLAKKLNLQRWLPPAPPRPHTHDFSHITVMLFGGKNPIFKFPGTGEVRVGRHVEDGKIRWNNLDLSAYDSLHNSLSRRHCRIFGEQNDFWVEDLDSLNGTWLNGRRLEPKKPARLKSRDYIQVGSIGMWVFLPQAPKESNP